MVTKPNEDGTVSFRSAPDDGTWVKVGVCCACGRYGQISIAERMCSERTESCLRIADRRKARATR